MVNETKREGDSEMNQPFLPTSASLEAFDLFDRLQRTEGATGVLFGAPGSGRSTTLREYARHEEPGSAVVVPCAPGRGPVQFLQDLVDRLDPEAWNPVGNARSGVRAALRVLRSAETELVLLDDAHRLYKPVLEILEELRERSGVSLLLSGPERELTRRLRRVPTLLAAIERVRTLRPLEAEEVEDVLTLRAVDLRLPRTGGADLVQDLHLRSGGNWSRLLRLVARCGQEARSTFRAHLDRRVIHRAAEDTGLEAA